MENLNVQLTTHETIILASLVQLLRDQVYNLAEQTVRALMSSKSPDTSTEEEPPKASPEKVINIPLPLICALEQLMKDKEKSIQAPNFPILLERFKEARLSARHSPNGGS
ncbi:MAG: hypothetical protein ABI430_02265 [Candidatus Taylorbacteria bacterium]